MRADLSSYTPVRGVTMEDIAHPGDTVSSRVVYNRE